MKLADGRSLSGNMKIIRKNSRSVHETIVAQVPVSRKYIPDEFNELTLQFNNRFAIIFRAYNDGVAYRIRTSFKDSIVVLSETAAISVHAGCPCLCAGDTKKRRSGCFSYQF